jgi:transcriptional regulator with XRE-family HTH domain
MGWKASKLAAVLGVSETTVSRWENGHQVPSRFHRERIHQVLGITPPHEGGPTSPRAAQFPPTHLEELLIEWGVSVGNRREFLKQLAGAVGIAALAPLLELSDGEPLHRLSRIMQQPRAVDAATIEHLEAVTAAQRELYHSLTSEELIQAVTGHLRLAKVLLHQTPREELRRRLAAIVTETAGHAAWLSYDLSDRRSGEHYYVLAGVAARETGDPALGAYLQGFKSIIRASETRTRDALLLLEEASETMSPCGSATMVAWLAGLQAQILACIGESKTCYQTLRRAEAAIGQAERGEDPPWMFDFDAGRLHAVAGSCYRRLGKTSAAEQALGEAMASLSASCHSSECSRRRSEVLVELSWVALQKEDIDEACRLAGESLASSLEASSMMGLKRVRELRAALDPWQDARAVAELDEQLISSF